MQKNTGRISEADFVRFLLKGARITPKRKAALIKKLETLFPPNTPGRGVSFPSFKVCVCDEAFRICIVSILSDLLDPDPNSEYGSGSKVLR